MNISLIELDLYTPRYSIVFDFSAGEEGEGGDGGASECSPAQPEKLQVRRGRTPRPRPASLKKSPLFYPG